MLERAPYSDKDGNKVSARPVTDGFFCGPGLTRNGSPIPHDRRYCMLERTIADRAPATARFRQNRHDLMLCHIAGNRAG